MWRHFLYAVIFCMQSFSACSNLLNKNICLTILPLDDIIVYVVTIKLCTSGGTADATDSKSVGSDIVWVQIPPGAFSYQKEVLFLYRAFFWYL